jgi:tRNA A37 threonylcarbamoyladenosine dehydratase
MQDIRIAQMQVVIDEMNRNIKAVHEEIGRMKDKMMDASTSGDIHRLNPIIPTRN